MSKKDNIEMIANTVEVLETSEATISQRALAYALMVDDTDEAHEVFELIRARAKQPDHEYFEVDSYIEGLNDLSDIAKATGQRSAVKDLSVIIKYLNNNKIELSEVLKAMKRAIIFEGLKENYFNN